LTEYFSLDVEFGFIDGPEDAIQLERELLTDIFENLNSRCGNIIRKYRREPLPSMLETPCWELDSCLEMLRSKFGRTDLLDDLDPEANANFANLQNKRADSLQCSFLDFRLRRARSTPPRAGRRAPRAVSICYSKGLKSQLEASVCTGAKI
jgi:nondiscriminating aspartyl-tRNA synthetase